MRAFVFLMLMMVGLGAATIGARLAIAAPGTGPAGSDVSFHASLNNPNAKMYTINKFGDSDDLDDHATDIWDGADIGSTDVWVPPTQARLHEITSTSDVDSDTGGAIAQGAGMRTIKVYGLTSWTDSAETTEIVVMDGTDGTDTVNAYVIIYRMAGITWGAGGLNAGTVVATAATDATITAGIVIGNNNTHMAIYGISSTMKLRVSQFYAFLSRLGASGTATGHVLFMMDPANNAADNTAWSHIQHFGIAIGVPWIRTFSEPKMFNGPGIIKVQMIGSVVNMMAIAEFDGVVIRD